LTSFQWCILLADDVSLRGLQTRLQFLVYSLDLRTRCTVFVLLLSQEASRQIQLGGDAAWGEQVGVGQLVVAAAEVVGLDQTLVEQGLEQVMGLAEAHAQGARQLALADFGLFFDQAENAVVGGFAGGHGYPFNC